MKKNFSLWALALLSVSAWANDVPGMLVQNNDGSRVEVGIDQIRSIRFLDGQMIISHKDDTQQSLLVDAIAEIRFGSLTTALESLMRDNHDGQVTILNLAGEVIYQGSATSSLLPASLKGIYIISIDGQRHKVNIQ